MKAMQAELPDVAAHRLDGATIDGNDLARVQSELEGGGFYIFRLDVLTPGTYRLKVCPLPGRVKSAEARLDAGPFSGFKAQPASATGASASPAASTYVSTGCPKNRCTPPFRPTP